MPGVDEISIGNAVVLPEYANQAAQQDRYYEELNRQQKQKDKVDRLAQQKRQDALSKYSGGLFADKNFLTGTEYDPSIHGGLVEGQKMVADAIKADPSMSWSDIQTLAAQKTLPIAQLSDKVKFLNKGLSGMSEPFKKLEGVDQTALQRQAMFNATHDIVDGKPVLKHPDDIDTSPEALQGYMQQVIQETPDVVIASGGVSHGGAPLDWRNTFDDKTDKHTVSGDVIENLNGRDLKKSLNGELYNFQQIDFDPKTGKPILDPLTGRPKVSVLSQMAPAAVDGTPSNLKIADNSVYEHFVSDPRRNLWVADQFKKMNNDREANKQEPIKYNSMVGDIARKKIVLDALSTMQPAKLDYDYSNNNDKAWAMEQRQLNAEKNIRLRASLKGTEKEPKENFVSAGIQVINGNPEYLKGDEGNYKIGPITLPFKNGQVNITGIFPGGTVLSDKQAIVNNPDPSSPTGFKETKTHVPYAAVIYDKNSGKVFTKDTPDDKLEDQGNIKDWLKSHATANGVTTKEADKLLKALDEPTQTAPSKPAQKTTPKSTNKWDKYKRR